MTDEELPMDGTERKEVSSDFALDNGKQLRETKCDDPEKHGLSIDEKTIVTQQKCSV